MARRLAKEEGFVRYFIWRERLGSDPGCQRPENKGKLIVTFAPSTGERYLSTPLAAEAKAEVADRQEEQWSDGKLKPPAHCSNGPWCNFFKIIVAFGGFCRNHWYEV